MKDKKPTLNCRINADVKESLTTAAKETGLSQTAVVQLLIRNWRKLLEVK